jgi:hypothetical protein
MVELAIVEGEAHSKTKGVDLTCFLVAGMSSTRKAAAAAKQVRMPALIHERAHQHSEGKAGRCWSPQR